MSTISFVLFYINQDCFVLPLSAATIFFVVFYTVLGSELSFFSLAVPKNISKIILEFSISSAAEGQSKIVDKPLNSDEAKELMIF